MSLAVLIAFAVLGPGTQVEFPANTLILLGSDGTIRQISPVLHEESDHTVIGAVDIEIGPDGLLYVLKTDQIQAFDAAFTVHRTIDSADPSSQFGAITFDSHGRVVVTDSHSGTIVVFAADGTVATTFDGGGTLGGLTDLAIGNNGHMYVTREAAGKVLELDASGDPVDEVPVPAPRAVMIGTGGSLLVVSHDDSTPGVWSIAMREGLLQGTQIMPTEAICAAGLGTYYVSAPDGNVRVVHSTGWGVDYLDMLFLQNTLPATAMTMVPQRLRFKALGDFTNGDVVEKSTHKGVVSIWPDGNLVALAYPSGEGTEYRLLRGSPYGTGGDSGQTEGNQKAMIGGSAVEDGSPLARVSTLRLSATGKFQIESTQSYEEFERYLVSTGKGTLIEIADDGVERLRIEITKPLN